MKRRKEFNGSLTSSDTTDYQQLNGRRTNGRVKYDETDTGASSVESRDRIPVKSYNKTSRGGPDRSTVVPEKAPSIEGWLVGEPKISYDYANYIYILYILVYSGI